MIFYDKMENLIANGIILYKPESIKSRGGETLYIEAEKAKFYRTCDENQEDILVSVWSNTPHTHSQLAVLAGELE